MFKTKICSKRLPLVVLGIIILASVSAVAQEKSLAALLQPIADEIAKSHARNILVLPLLDPKDGPSDFGAFLARQISEQLAKSAPGLEVLDGNSLSVPLKPIPSATRPIADWKAVHELGKRSGADIMVTGDFAPFGNLLGISLMAVRVGTESPAIYANGGIAISPNASINLATYVPPEDGIYQTGHGGITTPSCASCPDPTYTDVDRRAGTEGTVVLAIVVKKDGTIGPVRLLRAPSATLGERAMQTVSQWRLHPALAPDGTPVPTRVQVEVTFHIYRHRR